MFDYILYRIDKMNNDKYLNELDTPLPVAVLWPTKIVSTSDFALRVKRADGKEKDIGWAGNYPYAPVDYAAIWEFLGNLSGHVIRQYDQTGNGNDDFPMELLAPLIRD